MAALERAIRNSSIRPPGACPNKFCKPRFGFGLEHTILPAPDKSQFGRVQSMVRQYQPLTLLICQPIFNQRKVQIFISSIQFITHDWMAEMRQMDSDLVLAACVWLNAQEGEGLIGASG